MEYILSLHPKYLGRRLQETIKSQLYNEVEGKYFPGIGYVLMYWISLQTQVSG